uniref:Uncharacterized protein n=1 Tax=Oryza glumipatula TaxID=40148 RepID=A0A0E0BQ23_9ORYZ
MCASIDVTRDFTKILIAREGGNHALERRGGAGAAAGRVGGWGAAHAGAVAARQTEQPTGRRGVRRVGGAGSAGIDTVGMLVGLTPTTSPSLGHTEPMVAASWAPWDDSIDTPSPLPHQILDFARKVFVRYVQRH